MQFELSEEYPCFSTIKPRSTILSILGDRKDPELGIKLRISGPVLPINSVLRIFAQARDHNLGVEYDGTPGTAFLDGAHDDIQ